MIRPAATAALLAAILQAQPAAADALPPVPPFRGEVLALHDGLNEVTLDPAGTRAVIVRSHFDNGNAHGADAYQVAVPGADGRWSLVPLEAGDGRPLADRLLITDDPRDGRAYRRSVVFATEPEGTGRALVLYIAHRRLPLDAPDGEEAPVEVIRYVVAANPDAGPGLPARAFHAVARSLSADRYPHAGHALVCELEFPADADLPELGAPPCAGP